DLMGGVFCGELFAGGIALELWDLVEWSGGAQAYALNEGEAAAARDRGRDFAVRLEGEQRLGQFRWDEGVAGLAPASGVDEDAVGDGVGAAADLALVLEEDLVDSAG